MMFSTAVVFNASLEGIFVILSFAQVYLLLRFSPELGFTVCMRLVLVIGFVQQWNCYIYYMRS